MAAKTRPKSDAPDASDRVSRIREGVTAAILEHRLLPGTKLGEDEIGDIYGASRTLVRTALQQLAHEGIVNIEKNRGAFVARPTPADAREVFEARRLIEPAIVDHAIDAASPAWIDRLQRHLAEEREAELRGDTRASVRLSGAFHVHLVEALGNAELTRFLADLLSRSSVMVSVYEPATDSICAVDEHGAIVDALKARDVARAIAVSREHFLHVESRLHLDDEAGAAAQDLAAVFGAIRPRRRRGRSPA